jgi:hypothetical protein
MRENCWSRVLQVGCTGEAGLGDVARHRRVLQFPGCMTSFPFSRLLLLWRLPILANPCGDVIAGIRSDQADCDEVKQHWPDLLKGSPFGDGERQNKLVVKRTLAALCGYDDQILGKYMSERLRDEDDVDLMAQNLVAFWFEKRISFRDNSLLRLLFLFELLTSAFDFRRSVSAAAKEPRKIKDLPCLYEQGWDDNDELQGWQNTLK